MSQLSTPSKSSKSNMKLTSWAEKREHRRHDLETQEISVDRCEVGHRPTKTFGRIVDISAGGVRIRTNEQDLQADHQIRVKLDLPAYAGISPFISSQGSSLSPKSEWEGWMTVSRVAKVGKNEFDVAGQLVDMDEIDRGMLGLYLSTQPLAA